MSEDPRFRPDDGNPPARFAASLARPMGEELKDLAASQRRYVRLMLRRAGIRSRVPTPSTDEVLRAYEVLRHKGDAPMEH